MIGTTEWMGTHIDRDLRGPRTELVLTTEKFLEDKALEGETYEYIPIANMEPIPHSTLGKEDVSPAVSTLVKDIKNLPLNDLKHVYP